MIQGQIPEAIIVFSWNCDNVNHSVIPACQESFYRTIPDSQRRSGLQEWQDGYDSDTGSEQVFKLNPLFFVLLDVQCLIHQHLQIAKAELLNLYPIIQFQILQVKYLHVVH